MHQIQHEKSIRLTELSLILVYLYVLYLTLPLEVLISYCV